MVDVTRPWSLAYTPIMWNPRRLRSGPRGQLLPITTGVDEYLSIMEKPKPWHYLEDGFVLWEGPSPIDGQEIVAIVTGTSQKGGKKESENVKTGAMLQTWILLKHELPQLAIDSGRDRAICGDCCHRGGELETPRRITRRVVTPEEAAAGHGIAGGPPARKEVMDVLMGGRSCYVVAAQAPTAIWKAYKRGKYPKVPPSELPLIGYGRLCRLGSYGDPAMVPVEVWRGLVWDSLGWTGYTHQWKERWAQPYRQFLMASVDNESELYQAQDMGWRTFRVLRGDEQIIAGLEIVCPASEEGGYVKTCDSCRACQGAMPGRAPWRERPSVPSVGIKVHPRWQVLYWPRGPKKKRFRGHRPDMEGERTKQDPARRPSEQVIFDHLAGVEAKEILKKIKKASKYEDPEAYIDEVRVDFPDYTQSGFDRLRGLIPAGKKKRAKVNPRAPHEVRRELDRLRLELDDAEYFNKAAPVVAEIRKRIDLLERELAEAEHEFERGVRRGMSQTRQDIFKDEWRRGFYTNPTMAQEILEDAVRPCMTREEAHQAAQSMERSLSAVQRHSTVSGPLRDKILNALWKARKATSPSARIRHLSVAERLLEDARRAKSPARRRRRRRKEGTDPRLGHFLHGPPLTPEAMARRRAFEAETELELAANPLVRMNPLLAIVGNPGPAKGDLDPGHASPPADLKPSARDGQRVLIKLTRGHYTSAPWEKAVGEIVGTTAPQFATTFGPNFIWVARRLDNGRYHTIHPMELNLKRENPSSSNDVDPRALAMRDRYREDLAAGHDDAAEYWRGQASAYFTANPRGDVGRHRKEAMRLIHEALDKRDFDLLHEAHEHLAEAYRCCSNPPNPDDLGVLDQVLEEIESAEHELLAELHDGRQKGSRAVAASGKRGRVKGKGKKAVKKNFKATKPKKFKAPKKKRYSLEEARKKFKGFDKAFRAYREFHDRNPGHVDVYELEDGESAVSVDDVHVALHRTLETNYLVPWDSNKKGSYWKHEHIEGAMDGKVNPLDRVDDLPLEVWDIKRNRTIKLPNGRWYLSDWWREKGGRGERRRH